MERLWIREVRRAARRVSAPFARQVALGCGAAAAGTMAASVLPLQWDGAVAQAVWAAVWAVAGYVAIWTVLSVVAGIITTQLFLFGAHNAGVREVTAGLLLASAIGFDVLVLLTTAAQLRRFKAATPAPPRVADPG